MTEQLPFDTFLLDKYGAEAVAVLDRNAPAWRLAEAGYEAERTGRDLTDYAATIWDRIAAQPVNNAGAIRTVTIGGAPVAQPA